MAFERTTSPGRREEKKAKAAEEKLAELPESFANILLPGDLFSPDDWAAYDPRLMVALFAYQGYDPRVTHTALLRLGAAAGYTVDMISTDIMALITYYVSRGTKMSRAKTIGRTKADGQTEMKRLRQIYNIIDTTPKNATDITLARIAGTQPSGVCITLQRDLDGIKVIGDRVLGLPKGLHSPIAPAVIPENFETLWRAWKVHSKNFTITVTKKTDGKDMDDLYSTNVGYGEIVRRSDLVGAEERLKTTDALYVSEFKRASPVAKVALAYTYHNDAFHQKTVGQWPQSNDNVDVWRVLGLDVAPAWPTPVIRGMQGTYSNLGAVDKAQIKRFYDQLLSSPEGKSFNR